MTKVPSIGYKKLIRAFKRDGWVVVRQKGSHIRLQKYFHTDVLKINVEEGVSDGEFKKFLFLAMAMYIGLPILF